MKPLSNSNTCRYSKSVELYKEQQQTKRHLEKLSQRFLTLVISISAVIFIFVRPEWVDFFLGSSFPTGEFRITVDGGGKVGNFGMLLAQNNGYILHGLVAFAGVTAVSSCIWAVRVLHSSTLQYDESEWLSSNRAVLESARIHLQMAYYHLGIAVSALILAGFGFICLYIVGGIYVLMFDLLTIVLTFTFLIGIWVLIPPDSQKYQIVTSDSLVWRAVMMGMWSTAASVFIIFVFWNAVGATAIWVKVSDFLFF